MFTARSSQSESVANVSELPTGTIITIAYNDEAGEAARGTILQSSAGRLVCPGASLAGYSWSADMGSTWQHQKIYAPIGWAGLWGDPAIAHDPRFTNLVYMAFLAMPNSKLPWGTEGPTGDCVSGGLSVRELGGICVARSTDGGRTFKLRSDDCLQATDIDPTGDFLDGSSIAVDRDGNVYVASHDISVDLDFANTAIRLWRSPAGGGPWSALTPPFVGIATINHPRLAVGTFNANRVYVLAQSFTRSFYLGYFLPTSTGVESTIVFDPHSAASLPDNLRYSEGYVRLGPQYALATVLPDPQLPINDGVRIAYTDNDSSLGHLTVRVVTTDEDLHSVPADQPGWSSAALGANGDQYSPAIACSPIRFGSGVFPSCAISYLSRQGNAGDLKSA